MDALTINQDDVLKVQKADPFSRCRGSRPGADPNLCMLHLIKHLCSIADEVVVFCGYYVYTHPPTIQCIPCIYKIIPYDLLDSSSVKRPSRQSGRMQCSACVSGKSSDPKINWLENNVSCIYWFMFILTCDPRNLLATGWPFLISNTYCFSACVCNCGLCQGGWQDGSMAGRQDGRLAGWGVVAGCCFQFGFRSVHFSIYLLWLFVHHYVALSILVLHVYGV